MFECSKAGRSSRVSDTPTGKMLLSLPSNDDGGLLSGKGSPLGAVVCHLACAGLASNSAAARKLPVTLALAVSILLVGAMDVVALCRRRVLVSIARQQHR